MEPVNYLIFEIDFRKYAIPAGNVLEIIQLPELTVAEELPDHFAGIFDLRGRFVVVTDPEFRLSGEHHKCSISDSVIVLNGENHVPGLLVSAVLDVTAIPPEVITPVSEVFPDAGSLNIRFISGVVSSDEGIIFILDLQAVLSSEIIEGEDMLIPPGSEDDPEPDPPVRDEKYFAPGATSAERVIFRERAQSLRGRADEDISEEMEPYAVFLLDGELFGIRTANVAGFHEIKRFTPVPCCPPHIIGQTNLHGNIITLVDISPVVKTSGRSRESISKIIIVETPEGRAGIPVDNVEDVFHLPRKHILSLPAASRFADESFQLGAAAHKGKMITLLDIERILLNGGLIVEDEF